MGECGDPAALTGRIAALAAAAAMAGCLGSATSSLPGRASDAARRVPRSPIAHVVFIIQENRSFNNLFMGYPGATTASYGYDKRGRKIRLHAEPLGTNYDVDHSSTGFFAACDGQGKLPGTQCKMDGWNEEPAERGQPKNVAYAYVARRDVEPYWRMAHEYVLADRTFASDLDGSFVAHQYIVAANASRAVDFPLSQWGCEGGKDDTVPTLLANRTYGSPIPACFGNPTIGGEADAAGLSWRFYAGAIDGDGGFWSSYQADRKIFRGPDWSANVVSPSAQFLTDIGKGQLANITWITPTWGRSDHPGLNGVKGPAWVASLVNAIGESKFWNSTAIFVIWDDWGGWFDPVRPVYEDYDGLGFRVPLLMVSPYAKRGYVTHVQYETASVLRFIEDNFGLPHLAASDARASDPVNDAFDYRRNPRTFRKIGGAEAPEYWTRTERGPTLGPSPEGLAGGD